MKIVSMLAVAAMMALPFVVNAADKTGLKKKEKSIEKKEKFADDSSSSSSSSSCDHIDFEKVEGTYVVNLRTNSLTCPNPFQANGTIFQLILDDIGNGTISYLWAKTSDCSGEPNALTFRDIPVTLAFDATVNGLATLTLPDFPPSSGLNPSYNILFKTRNNKVTGFYILTNDSQQGISLFQLGEGHKNN